MSESAIGSAVLSWICPGLGQIMLCKDTRRGVMILVGFLGVAFISIAIMLVTQYQFPVIFGYPIIIFPTVAVYIWNIYDAYTLADKRFI
jgi:hypothetical protein